VRVRRSKGEGKKERNKLKADVQALERTVVELFESKADVMHKELNTELMLNERYRMQNRYK